MDDYRNAFSKNLLYYMKQKGLSGVEVSKIAGVSKQAVSAWCNGLKIPRMDKIELLANYFGIQKSDLIEEHDAHGTFPYQLKHKIPLLGRVAAGLPLYAEENVEGYIFTELNGGEEYFGLRIVGDSMNAARIQDGDVVIVRKQDAVENGEIAIVLVDDNDATVKKFMRTGNTVHLIPLSTNPKHQVQEYDLHDTRIKVLGKVVRVQFDM